MGNIAVLVLVLVAGIAQPFQVAMNAKLEKAVSPTVSGLAAFLGGALVVTLLWATGVMGRGNGSAASAAPWWAWLTGPIGVLIVFASFIALPRSNAAVVLGLLVLGQAVASLAVDHYGWLDVKRVPLSSWRVGGAILLLAGVLMMQKS